MTKQNQKQKQKNFEACFSAEAGRTPPQVRAPETDDALP